MGFLPSRDSNRSATRAFTTLRANTRLTDWDLIGVGGVVFHSMDQAELNTVTFFSRVDCPSLSEGKESTAPPVMGGSVIINSSSFMARLIEVTGDDGNTSIQNLLNYQLLPGKFTHRP